ncbi:glycine receptor subunit alpha-4 [Lepeophtheirus salmonis]|nr:glycine receptor subunit alpha-4-like [Lepeophtheirus salmonis]
MKETSILMFWTFIQGFCLLSLSVANNVHSLDGGSQSKHKKALDILDSLLQNYDRRATPTNHIGKATEVAIKLYVRSLGSINPDTMDYQVDLYLRQHWFDSRLNHPGLLEPMDLNDPNLVKALWKPEVYFPNAKDAEFQYVTVPNVLVRIDPGGAILYMLRLKLKFSCMMELSKFPLDEQYCTMEIASFSKTTKELILRWKDTKPIDISKEVKMPQFEISTVIPSICQETFHIGNYSCLLAQLHLKRSLGFHMVQSYIPTILIVVISWVSFWMDVESVAGRTTLGVTTLLTVSSKASDVQAEVPLVSYVKAIDIWMGACTAFIFAALLEFTFVNYMWRRGKKKTMYFGIESGSRILENQKDKVEDFLVPLSQINEDNEESCNQANNVAMERAVKKSSTEVNRRGQVLLMKPTTKNRRKSNFLWKVSKSQGDDAERRTALNMDVEQSNGEVRMLKSSSDDLIKESSISEFGLSHCKLALQIDECSRFIFPLCFLIFNLLYWSYYT